MTISGADLELIQALIALVLLGLSLICLPLAYTYAWRTFSTPERRSAGLTLALGALVRWGLAPPLLAMIFIGYKQTEYALTLLPLSHYGVGATALYHAIFGFFQAPDHRTMIAINQVIGVMTLPLIAAWAARLLKDTRAGLIALWLVSLTPLFVRNDLSEANIVPTLWWLMAGLICLDTWMHTARATALAAAIPLLALAAMARPEMPLLVVVFIALTALGSQWPTSRLRPSKALICAGTSLVALTTPHVIHTLNAMDTLSARASLPGLSSEEFWRLPTMLLLERNITIRPDLFPIGMSAAALLAFAPWSKRRLFSGALMLACFLTLGVYVVDLDEANIARVQVPGALLFTLLAAGGISTLWSRTKPLGALGLVLVTLSGLPSVEALWADANEHTEERLIRATEATLESPEPFTLIRLGERDRRAQSKDSQFTHYHFPDYLFRPPSRPGVIRSAGDFLEEPELSGDTYFFHGMRCYAEFRSLGVTQPQGADLHPACRAMHERFLLQPVFEEEAPNHGDVWIRYYGSAESLRVGLYKVVTSR